MADVNGNPVYPILNGGTSADAKILGENHIGYDWCEIDWSNADDGYVRIKINEQTTSHAICKVHWYEDEISVQGDSMNYAVTIEQGWRPEEVEAMEKAHDNIKTEAKLEEIDTIYRDTLTACFTGEAVSEDTRWLLSTMDIDFENAPLTCAKALEITKNCKTDAEKVTAVFNWVASNIKYNHKLSDEIIAWGIETNARKAAGNFNPVYDWFQDGTRMYLDLDKILTTKSGVCEDYATLMVGMLRSLGIPCKYVSGDVYSGKIIEGYNDNNPGWASHGWVAVSPDVKDLNLSLWALVTKPTAGFALTRLMRTTKRSQPTTRTILRIALINHYNSRLCRLTAAGAACFLAEPRRAVALAHRIVKAPALPRLRRP